MAAWPYSNIRSTSGANDINPGPPSVTLTATGVQAGDLLVILAITPSVNTPTGFATAGVSGFRVDPAASDINYATLFSKIATGSETSIVVSGNDTSPQDGLAALLFVFKGGGSVDAATTGTGGSGTITSPSLTVVSGNTEIVCAITQLLVGASPDPTLDSVYDVATVTPNNEVEGIVAFARRVGPGASGGVQMASNGTIPSFVSFSVSLPYPGRTIRRIDFT